MSAPYPALFLGHGSPMHALEPSRYTEAWSRLGRELPAPRAIVAVSAHWTTRGTAVTAQERPRTIHDFHGFPPALYEIQYPAPGDPALAARLARLLAPTPVQLDSGWGLDHGTWAVLRYMYPAADVPVVQLSLDAGASPQAHFALAQRLALLRDEGVLVLGSGNVVHNLRALRPPDDPTWPWAERFDAAVRRAIRADSPDRLIDYATLDETATLSVPTTEHYLPLLYVMALRRAGETVGFPVEGFDLGSISMLCVQVGGAQAG